MTVLDFLIVVCIDMIFSSCIEIDAQFFLGEGCCIFVVIRFLKLVSLAPNSKHILWLHLIGATCHIIELSHHSSLSLICSASGVNPIKFCWAQSLTDSTSWVNVWSLVSQLTFNKLRCLCVMSKCSQYILFSDWSQVRNVGGVKSHLIMCLHGRVARRFWSF